MLVIEKPKFSLREYLVDKWCPRKGYQSSVRNANGEGLVLEVFEVITKKNWLGTEYISEKKKVLSYCYYHKAHESWKKHAGKRIYVLIATKPYFDEVALLGEQLENELEIEDKENIIFHVKCE